MDRLTQLIWWAAGKPIHDTENDLCVPDFSCCRGVEYMADELARHRYLAAYMDRDLAVLAEMFRMFLEDVWIEQTGVPMREPNDMEVM